METMLRYHMAVVTPDKGLKRAIKRVTTATASTAQFSKDLASLSTDEHINFAIVDARTKQPTKKDMSVVPEDAAIAYILEEDNLIQIVDMLADKRVSSLLCHDDAFDDDEFIASATKALRRDIFGLQKYFPWGVTTYSMVLRNYEEKTRAIEIIMDYARQAGLRGPVRDRIQLVSDELMMNALYHAPVNDKGEEKYAEVSRKELTKMEVDPVEVHYGCSGRYFGLSIRDLGGSLTREKALQYLMRAKNATSQIETKTTGAGLGLISVLRSVSKLIFNLDPGHATEVIALFDMNLFAKGKVGARSLHVFLAEEQKSGTLEEVEHQSEEALAGRRGNPWPFIALLLGLVAVALGLAYATRTSDKPVSAVAQSVPAQVTVTPIPTDASITINGTAVQPSTEFPLPDGAENIEIVVSKPGFRTWTRQLKRSDVHGTVQLHVALDRRRR